MQKANALGQNILQIITQKQEKLKTYTLDQAQDKLIGKIGKPERDIFEYELQIDLIGKAIKQTRQERIPSRTTQSKH